MIPFESVTNGINRALWPRVAKYKGLVGWATVVKRCTAGDWGCLVAGVVFVVFAVFAAFVVVVLAAGVVCGGGAL